MARLFDEVTDLAGGAELLQRWAYGVIEAEDGRFRRVRVRPFPMVMVGPEKILLGRWYHRYLRRDRCLLYYNQPRRCPSFLVVKYIVSGQGTSYRTFRRAVEALDEVARAKGVDALLCDVANGRISPALMSRWGWEPHCPYRGHRHYIKRFYGSYPPRPGWIRSVPTGPPCNTSAFRPAMAGHDRRGR